MLTKIDLCSMALLKLGESPIQSLVDDTPSAALGRTLFDPVVETLLASHPWRFACSRFELMRNTDNDFQLPADCIRVISVRGEIVGDRIVAHGDKISVTAVMRTPVEKFPSYFATLVATKLAMEFCVPLSGDQATFRMLAALYESELQSAKFIDSTLSPHQGISNFPLLDTRF